MIPPSIREGGARLSRPPFWMRGIQYEADLLLEFTKENSQRSRGKKVALALKEEADERCAAERKVPLTG